MQNRCVAWYKDEERYWTGRLIQFMALHVHDDNRKVLVAHAIVEMADGRVKVVELHDGLDFRFIKED